LIPGEGAKDTEIPEDFLLQVRGNDSHNTRATQVKQHSTILFITMRTLFKANGTSGFSRKLVVCLVPEWVITQEYQIPIMPTFITV
jgi:hypothetical protein